MTAHEGKVSSARMIPQDHATVFPGMHMMRGHLILVSESRRAVFGAAALLGFKQAGAVMVVGYLPPPGCPVHETSCVGNVGLEAQD
jgi:hypothetical protein